MSMLFHSIFDLSAQAEMLGHGRHGGIEIAAGRLVAIHLRPWPKFTSVVEIEWLGRRRHACRPGDCCWLYYDQPRRFANFLAVKYAVSHRDCSLASIHRALETLDEIARLKRSDAILCDVWNLRISDRLLARQGWAPHKPQRWHRHFIKRFYGVYPTPRTTCAALSASGSAC